MARVVTVDQLREIYRQPKGRAAQKVIPQLEQHSKHIIELSPFIVISTTGEDGIADVSPRGDAPGFVKVLDDQTIAVPDRPGNNRLDTLTNILANPAVGTIFFVPGVDEVLRINGDAEIRDDAELLAQFEIKGKLPATVLVIKAREIYLHCAKAIMRSGLWKSETQVERSVLPTIGQMIVDQIGGDRPEETHAEVKREYEKVLY